MAEIKKRYDPYKEIAIIELFLGKTHRGKEFYAYLGILPKDYDAYKEAVRKAEAFNIMAYGKVLASGWGKPDEDTLNAMKEEYGADPTALDKIEIIKQKA